jgi:hypothetical protein
MEKETSHRIFDQVIQKNGNKNIYFEYNVALVLQ